MKVFFFFFYNYLEMFQIFKFFLTKISKQISYSKSTFQKKKAIKVNEIRARGIASTLATGSTHRRMHGFWRFRWYFGNNVQFN